MRCGDRVASEKLRQRLPYLRGAEHVELMRRIFNRDHASTCDGSFQVWSSPSGLTSTIRSTKVSCRESVASAR